MTKIDTTEKWMREMERSEGVAKPSIPTTAAAPKIERAKKLQKERSKWGW